MGFLSNIGQNLPFGHGKLRAALGMKPKEGGLFSGMTDMVKEATGTAEWFAKAKFWAIAVGATILFLLLRPWEWLIPRTRSRRY